MSRYYIDVFPENLEEAAELWTQKRMFPEDLEEVAEALAERGN